MNSKMKKRLFALAMMVVVTTSFTACGGQNTQTKTTSKIVNIGITNSPMNLNPVDPGDMASTQMVNILYQPLIRIR